MRVRMPRTWCVLGLLTLSVGATVVIGRPSARLTPQERRALEQLALADARTTLQQAIEALPVMGDVHVGDWTAASWDRTRALRVWIRSQVRHGSARFYSDGVCEVDVHVAPTALSKTLSRWVEDAALAEASPRLSTSQVRSAARRWLDVWGTGRASRTTLTRSRKPLGWQRVTHEGIELARRNAAQDAIAALMLEAGRLPLSDTEQLADFFASSDAVRAAVRAGLDQRASIDVEYDADPAATAVAEIDLRELLAVLTEVHQRLYRGSDVAVADFRALVMRVDAERLTAMGLADPPTGSVLALPERGPGVAPPSWSATTLRENGHFQPPPAEEIAERAQRVAARLDAIDALSQRVAGLSLSERVTVAEFLAYHQELKSDVVLFLSSARVVRFVAATETLPATAAVELPLQRLWEILRRRVTTVRDD